MSENININFVTNQLQNYIQFIDTIIGINSFTPSNPYASDSTYTNPIPQSETDYANSLVNSNKYNPSNEFDGYIKATTDKAETIGKFLLSGKGQLFLITQAALHLANSRTSKLLNPLVYPLGGFGILPDTFDALFGVFFESTTAKKYGQAHPGLSNIVPGKYGAIEQALGPYGFPYPRSGLLQIAQAVVDMVSNFLTGNSGVTLNKEGAIDYSKTPLELALRSVNYLYNGNTDITENLVDGKNNTVMVVEDGTGKVKILLGKNAGIKEKDKRFVETTVNLMSTDPIVQDPLAPLSPLLYNVQTKDRPYPTNLYRPLKLIHDAGYKNDTANLQAFYVNSDWFFDKKSDSTDPKITTSRKVNVNGLEKVTDMMQQQLAYEERQKYTSDGLLDSINTDIIAESYPTDKIEQYKDKTYVPLIFEALTIGNRSVLFRAYVNDWSDTFNPSWQEDSSYGRSQENVIYTNTKRGIGISFTVLAGHPKELVPMYSKINWLVRNCYPSFGEQGFIVAPPIIRFTLGDMFVGLPVYITSLDIKPNQNAMWEIEPGAQVPICLDISLSLGVLHERMPSAGSYFYPLSKTGFGNQPGDKVGNDGLFNTTILGKIR